MAVGNINELPENILLELFTHVPARQLLLRCRLVCSLWRDLIDLVTLWKRKCLREGFITEDWDQPVADWKIFYFLRSLHRNLLHNPCAEGLQPGPTAGPSTSCVFSSCRQRMHLWGPSSRTQQQSSKRAMPSGGKSPTRSPTTHPASATSGFSTAAWTLTTGPAGTARGSPTAASPSGPHCPDVPKLPTAEPQLVKGCQRRAGLGKGRWRPGSPDLLVHPCLPGTSSLWGLTCYGGPALRLRSQPE
uniref:F-box protein 44 n=1 Tax=Equus caballus TaxID=9796 RepID=A0A9L0RBV3_HORSE